MGQAILGDYRFRMDPSEVTWSFNIHTNDVKCVGGKVIQVFGASLGDMTVTGTFGVGGVKEQEAFLAKMKGFAKDQVRDAAVRNGTAPLLRFMYPPLKWDYKVLLTRFVDPTSGNSVHLEPGHFPKWQLTLMLVEDTANLVRVAQDAYISRLSAGLGWKQSQYNGPLSQVEVNATMNGKPVQQYLADAYGISVAASGP